MPRVVHPQQKAEMDMSVFGPMTFNNMATGPSKGTYVTYLFFVSFELLEKSGLGICKYKRVAAVPN